MTHQMERRIKSQQSWPYHCKH